MEKSTVLVVLNHETDDHFVEEIAETSVNLQIHVTCFVMSPSVEFPAAVYGIPPYGNIEISSE